jgi:predicted enzyme related to lactoylglutathione lyase
MSSEPPGGLLRYTARTEATTMASAFGIDEAFASMAPGAVPASRLVPELGAALELVTRLGGSVASEIRTVPGIGSWAFVTGVDGCELLLWETAPSD